MSDHDKAHRDAGTGQYVTDEYAEQHPATTVAEQRRARARGAVVEILERGGGDPDVIVPTDVRINGESILAPQQSPVVLERFEINGEELAQVTLTLFVRRLVIGTAD